MRTVLTFLSFLFIAIQFVAGQNYFTLTGKVLDKQSRQPISYAHVGIPEKGIGTTTGYDGSFEFKVPNVYANSTMIVSFMGYQTYKKPLRDYKNGSTVFIEKSSMDLIEVVVMEETKVEDIVRRAVRNIPVNYSDYPTTVLGFYRESLTDDSLQYRYMAEGVLNIHKSSYKKIGEGQVGLVQARKINLKNPLDTVVHSGLSSGHMAGHRFDFVKNREDFIDENFFPVYKYWIESVTTYNDRPVYIIGFDKDENGKARVKKRNKWKAFADALTGKKKNNMRIEGRMKGRIYIEQDSYAFIRAEFEILPEGLKKYDDYPLYAGSWRGNKYVVNYRKVDGKWYFSDALREGERSRGGIYANEIKITEINTERGSSIPYLERMGRGYQFVNLTGSYDDDFWKNYNTTPLTAGLAESVHQLENIKKAQEVFTEEYRAAIQQKRDSIQRMRDSIQAIEMLELKEQVAMEKGVDIEDLIDSDFMPEEVERINKVRRNFRRVRFSLGAGTHLLSTQEGPLSINYFDGDGETILSLTDDISNRDFEITTSWDFDIYFNPNFFMRFGNTFNYTKSIYKDWAIGVGTQVNLSKGRPVFLRAVAQYDYLRYARVVGAADNDYGKFEVKNKKFKAESIRLSYGSRLHNVKLTGELSIELNPGQELYFRGGYFWNFASQESLWFKERKEIFRKDKRLPIKNDQLVIMQNDVPFNDRITPDESFSITVGLLFK
ncbi:MAG: carboxypeptidase-like regulatory domain-containing protein [Bacteroidota bacterium]